MPRREMLRVIEKQEPLSASVTSVQRHPTNPHRVVLQFDDERPIELNIHTVLSLIESLCSVSHGVLVSEYEQRLGAEQRDKLAVSVDAVATPTE